MSATNLLAEVELRALTAERDAKKGGRGCKAEQLAACYRSAAVALRTAQALERGEPPTSQGAPPP